MNTRSKLGSFVHTAIAIAAVALTSAAGIAAEGWLTAVGTPPRAGSLQFLSWADRTFEHAYSSCPLARATTYYINQGTNNANAGTNPASPRNCLTYVDLATFINNNQGTGDVAFLLDENDTWRATAASPTTKITISQPRVTIGVFNPSNPTGPATAQAKLIGGVGLGNSGWLNATQANNASLAADYGNLWYRDWTDSTTCLVTWTTDNADEWRDFRRLDTPFRRYAPNTLANLTDELAQMDATAEDAFVVATNEGTHGRVYVRSLVGTFNSNVTLDRLLPTEDCIVVGGTGGDDTLDNVRIDSLIFIGWGLGDPSSPGNPDPASQRYAVRADISGNVMLGITRCSAYYGSHHQLAVLNSGAGDNGGLFWLDDIKVGYCGKDGASGATQINFYQPATGGQFVCRNVRGTHGAVKGWSTSVTAHNSATATGVAELIYAHTNTSSNVIDLMLLVGCGYDETATDESGGLFALSGRAAQINLNGLTTPWKDTTKFRAFQVNCLTYGNTFFNGGTQPLCLVNSHHVVRDIPTSGFFTVGGTGIDSIRMVMFNSTLDVIDTLKQNGTAFYWASQTSQSAGTSAWHMVHSFMRFKSSYRSVPVGFHNGNSYLAFNQNRMFNSGIFGEPGRTSITRTVATPVNAAASATDPGCAGLVVGPNTQESTSGTAIGFSNTLSPVRLSQLPSQLFNLVPISHWLRDAGSTVTDPDLALEYDGFGRPLGSPVTAGPAGGDLAAPGGGTGGTGLINERLVR